MKNNNLLPCPYCGGEPKEYTNSCGDYGDYITVIDCDCGLCIHNCDLSMEQKRDIWNKLPRGDKNNE